MKIWAIEKTNKSRSPEERIPPRNRYDLDLAKKAEAEKQKNIAVVPKKAIPRIFGSISITRETNGPSEHPIRVARPRRIENLWVIVSLLCGIQYNEIIATSCPIKVRIPPIEYIRSIMIPTAHAKEAAPRVR